MSDLKFPIYCEDMYYYYKIDSPYECLSVCTITDQKSITEEIYTPSINVESFDEFIAGEYEKITASQFTKAYTEVRELLDKKAK